MFNSPTSEDIERAGSVEEEGSDREYQPSGDEEEADCAEDESGRENSSGNKRKRSGRGKKGKGKGKGSRKRRRAEEGSEDDDEGTGAGPGDWMPYWHPDCKRNGHRYVSLQKMGEIRWTRKEKVEMMKTGGLKGVVGLMGAGFGGAGWETTVDSWAYAVANAGEFESLAEGVTFPILIQRCSASIQKGIAASFFSMVSYVQLFLKAITYVLS